MWAEVVKNKSDFGPLVHLSSNSLKLCCDLNYTSVKFCDRSFQTDRQTDRHAAGNTVSKLVPTTKGVSLYH